MSAGTLREDTLYAAVRKAVADEIAKAVKTGKKDLKQIVDDLSIKTLTARLPDGTEVGTVGKAGGGSVPEVADERKFLAWVKENRPGEVVETVRESYWNSLSEAMKKTGEPIDPETGERIPGVAFKTTTEYLTVNLAKGEPGRSGHDLIMQALLDKQISLNTVLALPAGEGVDAA